MKRSVTLLAGFFCLAICACAQLVPPPPVPPRPPVPPPPPTGLIESGVICSDGSDLLDHVYFVNLTISPAGGGTNTVAPNSVFNLPTSAPVNDENIRIDLAAAFNANKKFALNMLCPPSGGYNEYSGLDAILINTAGCTSTDPSSCSSMRDQDVADNSWALRTPVPSGSTACVPVGTGCKKYVAISLGLWRLNTSCPDAKQSYCAPTFTDFQTRLNQALLDRTAANGTPVPVSVTPKFSVSSDDPSSSNDDPSLAVLAALAHERGHIYWFERFVQPPGSAQTTNTDQFCGSGAASFYPTGKWQGEYPVGIPDRVMPRFVTFAELDQNSSLNQASLNSNLPYLLFYGLSQYAKIPIDNIYMEGQYLSLLAAYSPDEDFVESFEWSVLRNSKKKDLGWTADGYPILEHGDGHFPGVKNKLKCFDKVSQ
jgi:hypothetical protein